jgi:membrane-associated protein
MDYRRYTLFNLVGGIAWIWSMLFIGYFLGSYIPGVDQHIELVIIIVVALSLMPGIIGWLRRGRTTPEENCNGLYAAAASLCP